MKYDHCGWTMIFFGGFWMSKVSPETADDQIWIEKKI
jgi:hypothetical protein